MANDSKTKWIFKIFAFLDRMDRRIVYGVVFLSLLIPILLNVALEPPKLPTAKQFFDEVEALESRDDQIVFVAFDWSAGTQAENKPQTEALLEHLMRKRVKFAAISVDLMSKPFLINLPLKVATKLEADTGEKWEYGKDWVNLGYRPGLGILLQQLPKVEDIRELFKTDADGRPLREIPCMKNIRSFNQIPMLAEFTGLTGVFPMWIQFFQSKDHRPKFVHGCTSVTIPEAFIYLDSKQIVGLLEGAAGAVAYSRLLGYTPAKPNEVMRNMTSISLAHIVIVFFIALGNLGMFVKKIHQRKEQ